MNGMTSQRARRYSTISQEGTALAPSLQKEYKNRMQGKDAMIITDNCCSVESKGNAFGAGSGVLQWQHRGVVLEA